MRIAMVGGIERTEAQMIELGRRAGHDIELHSGHMAGGGSKSLARLIERADAVLILTDVNSHGAVHLARKLARKRGLLTWMVRRCGAARFDEILQEIVSAQGAFVQRRVA
jgi:hypothetical protein